jgi:hypothetical protein
MAFFERDYAKLEYEQKNFELAKEWAGKASEKFDELDMQERVNQMKEFLPFEK